MTRLALDAAVTAASDAAFVQMFAQVPDEELDA